MIANDQELQVMQERITHFQRWLAVLRQTTRPEEFEAVASDYRLEIERMQAPSVGLPTTSVAGRA
jgi:hypothetical protein